MSGATDAAFSESRTSCEKLASDCVGTNRTTVWALGPLPPPVNGMTLLTQQVLLGLQQVGTVRICNWSHGSPTMTVRARVRRVRRTLSCLMKLVRGGLGRGSRLYVVANSQSGLFLTAALVFVAQKLNYQVYLHHHTYGYIDRWNAWMAWINRVMERGGTHIVHCQQMIDDFRRQYASAKRFETIFPSIVSTEILEQRLSPRKPFILGLLSNLTIAKGVDSVIETFETLLRGGSDVRLKLAGPIGDRSAKACIDEAVRRYPDRVEYLGPVYGVAKNSYFSSIDALLFPTHTESWGIVINEALAAGAPVITFDQGCTRTVVGPSAGLVVPRDGDYVSAAVSQIEQWIKDHESYRSVSCAAIDQAKYLDSEGRRQLSQFAQQMFGPSDN